MSDETVVVTGAVEAVEAKANGRFVVKVRVNQSDQYPRNLNTKDANLALQLMQANGQMYQFQCGISRYEGPDGSPRESRWINTAVPAASAPPAPEPTPTTQSQPSGEPFKQHSIAFQSMAKGLAVECFKRLPTEQQTLESAVAIADYWALAALARGLRGIQGPSPPALTPTEVYEPQSLAAGDTPGGASPLEGTPAGGYPGDDDIPF